MRIKKFFDSRHAKQWLLNGVIRNGNNPVFVEHIEPCLGDDLYKLVLINLLDGGYKSVIFYPTEVININPVPLGMINWQNSLGKYSVSYLSRLPSRQWQIGLTVRNLMVEKIKKESNYITSEQIIKSLSLGKTIIGKYPGYSECFFRDKKKGQTTAFSRRFAISEGEVFFKSEGKPIGKALENEVVIEDDFFFLKECLEEDMNKNG